MNYLTFHPKASAALQFSNGWNFINNPKNLLYCLKKEYFMVIMLKVQYELFLFLYSYEHKLNLE